MKLTYKLVSALGGLMVFALVAITSAAVVARYVFSAPIQWTEEMSGFLLIWIVFLGAIGCEFRDNHLTIDAATMVLPKWLMSKIDLVVGLISVALLCAMAWLGYELALKAAMKKTQILRISWFWFDIAVTVGGLAMAVIGLNRTIQRLRGAPVSEK
jgi:TRAP-type C4-dicarboxylate transport system permease small subunit